MRFFNVRSLAEPRLPREMCARAKLRPRVPAGMSRMMIGKRPASRRLLRDRAQLSASSSMLIRAARSRLYGWPSFSCTSCAICFRIVRSHLKLTESLDELACWMARPVTATAFPASFICNC